jgi:Spy/CpxP family protein refolding chaperone
MRKLIVLGAIAFALAAGTSMMALTVHVDRAHIAQAGHYGTGHQKMSLLY